VRALRLLAIIMVIGLFYGASPLVGQWVTTASASTGSAASRPEMANAPANDNENDDEDCNTGNPRKDKKCNYNRPNNTDDNDNTVNDGMGTQPPVVGISVSNADPREGDTISFAVNASGYQLDQVWWWVSNFPNGSDNDNENGQFMNGDSHYTGCDGNNTCTQYGTLRPGDPGTFTLHAKVRDRQGRESGEIVTEIRVHD